MTILKRTSKVSPIDTRPTTQNNNYFVKDCGSIRQSRFIILIQAALGINRLNLLNTGGFVKWLGTIYSCVFVGLAIYALVSSIDEEYSGSYTVLKTVACIEYCLLVFSSIVLMKEKLQNFYYDLSKFDTMLNIENNLNMTSPIYSCLAWIILSVGYLISEYVLLSIYIPFFAASKFLHIWYLISLAHNTEQIFYVMLIRFILMRLQVLKGHITKAFHVDDKELNHGKTGKLENLANNTELDTSAMHRAYELLHKCAEELNTTMSFPMFVTLFTSGLGTTLYLKLIFQAGQFDDFPVIARTLIINAAFRCVKYTLLVIFPCYYSSTTAKQVSIIRTILHNAINNSTLGSKLMVILPLVLAVEYDFAYVTHIIRIYYTFRLCSVFYNKIERRKIKAFFLLVQDNDFSYALWGVIRFNMALPLSYTSLCTTYLIIIIQFSKFID